MVVFIREDHPLKLQSLEPVPVEGLYIELNIRKKKWLVKCFCNFHRNSLSNHLAVTRKRLDLYTSHDDNIIRIIDFNLEARDVCIYNHSVKFVDSKFWTLNFQNLCIIETGLYDFHRMVGTFMKSTFEKSKPKNNSI